MSTWRTRSGYAARPRDPAVRGCEGRAAAGCHADPWRRPLPGLEPAALGRGRERPRRPMLGGHGGRWTATGVTRLHPQLSKLHPVAARRGRGDRRSAGSARICPYHGVDVESAIPTGGKALLQDFVARHLAAIDGSSAGAGRGMSTLALRSAWRCPCCWVVMQRDRHDADPARGHSRTITDIPMLKLFYAPGSCALASHVALEEVCR